MASARDQVKKNRQLTQAQQDYLRQLEEQYGVTTQQEGETPLLTPMMSDEETLRNIQIQQEIDRVNGKTPSTEKDLNAWDKIVVGANQLGNNLRYNIFKPFEGIADAVMGLGATIGSWFGADTSGLEKAIANDTSMDIIDFVGKYSLWMDKLIVSKDAKELIGNYSQQDVLPEIVDKITEITGNVLGFAGMAAASGGLAAVGKLGTVGSAALNYGTIYASSQGSGLETALGEGYDLNRAQLYGAVSGAVETVSEALVGKLINGAGSKIAGVIDQKSLKGISTKAQGPLLNLFRNMNEEGIEEVVSSIAEPINRMFTLEGGENASWERYQELFNENGGFQNVLESYLGGALGAGIIGGGETIGNIKRNTYKGYGLTLETTQKYELRQQLAQEMAKGDKADQKKIANIQEAISKVDARIQKKFGNYLENLKQRDDAVKEKKKEIQDFLRPMTENTELTDEQNAMVDEYFQMEADKELNPYRFYLESSAMDEKSLKKAAVQSVSDRLGYSIEFNDELDSFIDFDNKVISLSDKNTSWNNLGEVLSHEWEHAISTDELNQALLEMVSKNELESLINEKALNPRYNTLALEKYNGEIQERLEEYTGDNREAYLRELQREYKNKYFKDEVSADLLSRLMQGEGTLNAFEKMLDRYTAKGLKRLLNNFKTLFKGKKVKDFKKFKDLIQNAIDEKNEKKGTRYKIPRDFNIETANDELYATKYDKEIFKKASIPIKEMGDAKNEEELINAVRKLDKVFGDRMDYLKTLTSDYDKNDYLFFLSNYRFFEESQRGYVFEKIFKDYDNAKEVFIEMMSKYSKQIKQMAKKYANLTISYNTKKKEIEAPASTVFTRTYKISHGGEELLSMEVEWTEYGENKKSIKYKERMDALLEKRKQEQQTQVKEEVKVDQEETKTTPTQDQEVKEEPKVETPKEEVKTEVKEKKEKPKKEVEALHLKKGDREYESAIDSYQSRFGDGIKRVVDGKVQYFRPNESKNYAEWYDVALSQVEDVKKELDSIKTIQELNEHLNIKSSNTIEDFDQMKKDILQAYKDKLIGKLTAGENGKKVIDEITRIENLENEVDDLRKEIDKLKENEELKNALKEIEEIKKKLKVYEDITLDSKKRFTYNELSNAYYKAKKVISDLNATLEIAQNNYLEMVDQNNLKAEEYKELDKKFSEYVSYAVKKRQDANDTIDKMKKTLEEAEKEAKTNNRKLNRTEKKLTLVKEELKTVKKELRMEKTKFNNAELAIRKLQNNEYALRASKTGVYNVTPKMMNFIDEMFTQIGIASDVEIKLTDTERKGLAKLLSDGDKDKVIRFLNGVLLNRAEIVEKELSLENLDYLGEHIGEIRQAVDDIISEGNYTKFQQVMNKLNESKEKYKALRDSYRADIKEYKDKEKLKAEIKSFYESVNEISERINERINFRGNDVGFVELARNLPNQLKDFIDKEDGLLNMKNIKDGAINIGTIKQFVEDFIQPIISYKTKSPAELSKSAKNLLEDLRDLDSGASINAEALEILRKINKAVVSYIKEVSGTRTTTIDGKEVNAMDFADKTFKEGLDLHDTLKKKGVLDKIPFVSKVASVARNLFKYLGGMREDSYIYKATYKSLRWGTQRYQSAMIRFYFLKEELMQKDGAKEGIRKLTDNKQTVELPLEMIETDPDTGEDVKKTIYIKMTYGEAMNFFLTARDPYALQQMAFNGVSIGTTVYNLYDKSADRIKADIEAIQQAKKRDGLNEFFKNEIENIEKLESKFKQMRRDKGKLELTVEEKTLRDEIDTMREDLDAKKKKRKIELEMKENEYIQLYNQTASLNVEKLRAQIFEKLNLGEGFFSDYVDYVDKFFTMAKEYKIQTDEKVLGFQSVLDGVYHPIVNESSKLTTDFSMDDVYNGSLGAFNPAFNIERKGGAVVRIRNEVDVINRYSQEMAMYYGFAEVVKNINLIFNYRIDGRTFKEIINSRFRLEDKDYFVKYIMTLLRDIHGYKEKTSQTDTWLKKWIGKFRTGFALFQLGFNWKVVGTQFASFGAATKYLTWNNLRKGFVPKKAFKDIEEPTLMVYRRLAGTITQAQTNGILEDASNFMTAGINFVDSWTIKKLWFASLAQTEAKSGKKYEQMDGVEKEQFVKTATELFEKVVNETQPNYDAIERSELMRTKNSVMQMFNMFKTQQSQMFSNVLELFFYEQARKNFGIQYDKKIIGRTMESLLFGTLMYAVMSWAFKKFFDGDWDDEPEEILLDITEDTLNGMTLQIIPLISNVLEIDFQSKTILNINEASFGYLQTWNEMISRINDGAYVSPKELIDTACMIVGIPTRNMYKTFKGVLQIFNPDLAADINLAYTRGMNQSKTASRTNIDYLLIDGKTSQARSYFKNYTKSVMELDYKTVNKMFDLHKEGYDGMFLKELPASYKKNGVEIQYDKRDFNLVYSRMKPVLNQITTSTRFNKLEKSQQAEIIQKIIALYHSLAKKWQNGQKFTNLEMLLNTSYDIDIETLIDYYDVLSMSEEEDNDIALKRKINGLKGDRGYKYLLYMLAGNKLSTRDTNILKGYLKQDLSKDELAYLLG